MNYDLFLNEANQFFVQLKSKMSGITLQPNWAIDHLCYRVSTLKTYLDRKSQFAHFSDLLGETEVNGRPISTFKLNNPLQFLNRQIDLVELPAPKNGQIINDGFEHIEVVCDCSFSEIRSRFRHHLFSDKGINKDFNPELELDLGDVAIKFHQLSLESVVTLESNKKVFFALRQSNILSEFKEYFPLVAGTFPLGIHTSESDIDILLYGRDLDRVASQLRSCFGQLHKFECYKEKSDEKEYAIARFVLAGVPFEVYAEDTETIGQRAYKHFQVEERLLKLGGSLLREKILELRAKGLKTEPAFGQVLGLGQDPYTKLLEMHTWSEDQLLQLVRTGVQQK